MSILGGSSGEAPPHFVRLEARLSTSPTRWETTDCAGTLYACGWIVTAAHCVPQRFEFIEAAVEPGARAAFGRTRYRVAEAAVHRLYEGCGDDDDACRHDVAMIRLPDDPGGGLAWPQTEQVVTEAGERVRLCGFGERSESLQCVEMGVLWSRAAILRLDEEPGPRFEQGDSGGEVFRAATGTQVAIISHLAPDPKTGRLRMYVMPFPAQRASGRLGSDRRQGRRIIASKPPKAPRRHSRCGKPAAAASAASVVANRARTRIGSCGVASRAMKRWKPSPSVWTPRARASSA